MAVVRPRLIPLAAVCMPNLGVVEVAFSAKIVL